LSLSPKPYFKELEKNNVDEICQHTTENSKFQNITYLEGIFITRTLEIVKQDKCPIDNKSSILLCQAKYCVSNFGIWLFD
jgi:hypothetical protein